MRGTKCAVLTAATLVGVLAGCASHAGAPAGGARPSDASATTRSVPPTVAVRPPATTTASATAQAPRRAPSAREVEALSQSTVTKIIGAQPKGGASVAALDLTTGRSYSAGARSGMWTASSYKLLVLVALIMRNGGVPGQDVATATRAIENSDNVAGYSLFEAAGSNSGIGPVLRKVGMTHTVLGQTDPTFTTTSARDCLKLLKVLVGRGALSASSRSFVLGLMRHVEADQRWGVGVVADKGTTFANKNGWLSIDPSNAPGETDHGLWAVTSLGIVTVAGHQVLMAVLTQHQKSFGAGVALVQRLASVLARAVVPTAR